jgi:hypothetical protein
MPSEKDLQAVVDENASAPCDALAIDCTVPARHFNLVMVAAVA